MDLIGPIEDLKCYFSMVLEGVSPIDTKIISGPIKWWTKDIEVTTATIRHYTATAPT